MKDVIWECADSVEVDTVSGGEKNFKLVDRQRQYFDFHLTDKSRAINAAMTEEGYGLPVDRDGKQRDGKPDIGCYEFVEEPKE